MGTIVSACGGDAESPYGREALVQARSAHELGDSLGVNVHLSNIDTSYADFGTLQSRLRELGVTHIRDGICPTCQYQMDRLKWLGASGVKADIVIGSLEGGTTEMQTNLAAIRDRLPGVVESVEAPNEPDAGPDPHWMESARAYQSELFTRVKGDPALAALPVLGPALVHRHSRAALGDISAYLDRGNLHPYPGGAPPLSNLEDERRLAAKVSKNKPLWITEVGYHSDNTRQDHLPASERAIQLYTPRIALETFNAGIERAYIYQLADPFTDAEARARNFPLMENRFGLLRADMSRKPSYLALRNLLRAVQANSAPVRSPGGLRLALRGAGFDVRRLLLRAADGSFSLVLWRGASVWDVHARRDQLPRPDHLEVVFDQPVALARRFDPVSSDSASERWKNPKRISVALEAEPVVLRLTLP